MRVMIIDKSNHVRPNRLEDRINKVLLVRAVIPLTQIARAIGVFSRWLYLYTVHTSFALEPYCVKTNKQTLIK